MSLSGAGQAEVLRDTATGVLVLLVLAALGIALASTLSRPHQHFRRQLWPDLRADATTGSPR